VHAWNGLSYHAAKEDAEEGAQWRFEVTHIKDATTLQVLRNRFLRDFWCWLKTKCRGVDRRQPPFESSEQYGGPLTFVSR
jgi:hypothetical protein